MKFEWDLEKDALNIKKHGISFKEAKLAFYDADRIINVDIKHSTASETRYFCFGKTDLGVLTVRFSLRNNSIRIFGAGLWRNGRKTYEKENKI